VEPLKETQKLHGAVVEQWGSEIVRGVLAAGHCIAADRAAAGLGVSRTVVREAVRVLESMGLVEARRRVGITVLPESRWNPFNPQVLRWRLAGPARMEHLRSLSELRDAVEPMAARLAAQRATSAQLDALTAAVTGMSTNARTANSGAYLAADAAFHTTLLEAAGNPMFAWLTSVVVAVLEGRTEHALMPQVADTEALRLHQVVATAIQAGDATAAETAMRAIISNAAREAEELAKAGAGAPGQAARSARRRPIADSRPSSNRRVLAPGEVSPK
jgi:DNA-binding FadR family transcriptional regulator